MNLEVGMSAHFSKTISESDVYSMAGIIGDFNPVHVDEEYAKKTIFKGRIAHGVLGIGLISTVAGMKLPGPGAIYLDQQVKFISPIHFGETATATITIQEINKSNGKVLAKTEVHVGERLAITGEAKFLVPDIKE
jgi:3-hydroxybutyryl-CoA dehydratase